MTMNQEEGYILHIHCTDTSLEISRIYVWCILWEIGDLDYDEMVHNAAIVLWWMFDIPVTK